MADVPEFLRAPVTTTIRSVVERELNGKATDAELRMLTSRPYLVPWLRVLQIIQREVEDHTAKDRARIAHLKPQAQSGRTPSEYLQAKHELDQRLLKRIVFLNLVKTRQREVELRISSEALTKQTLGSIIQALVRVEGLLDDHDWDGAHDLLSSLIDNYERAATPDQTVTP